MSRCPSPQQLQQLLEEQLNDVVREAIETHVEGCRVCQEALARLSDSGPELDTTLLGDPRPPLSQAGGNLARYLENNPPAAEKAVSAALEGTEPAPITFPGPPTAKGPLGQLDSFAICKELGRGKFGVVYQACDELDRLVALKVLKPELAASAPERARFEKEARRAAAVKDDHIVTIHQVGHTPGFALPYLVMEYLEGEALSERLRRQGVLEPKEAARIAQQVAWGLAAAHARGLVHRDIKPSNILLETASGRAKITDFGLARVVEGGSVHSSQSGGIVGTPAYLSPEQILAPDRLDGRTDIYSLGVVLYELLTGERPFRGVTHRLLEQVVHEEPRPPRKLNDRIAHDLETITCKCLAKEPGGRYQTAGELAEDLQRWLDGKPIQARPAGVVGKLGRWCRRKPAVASLLAALVLVVAGGFAGVTWQWRRAEASYRGAQVALAAEAKARQSARQALDEMSSQVIEDWLSQRAKMEPAQRRFLEKALAYYEEFAAESGDTEEVRRGVAHAYFRVGFIRDKLGQHHEAEAAYHRARDLYSQLAADFPTVTEYRQYVARIHHNLAIVLRNTGRAQQAEAAYRDALALFQQLAADFPTAPEYRHELARSDNSRGILLVDMGRLQEAEAAVRNALALRQQLAADFPAVPAYRRELAITHNNLGNLLQITGRPKEAEAAYRDALAVFKQLAADFPTVPEYRLELANSHNNLGVLLANTDRLQEAEAAVRDGLALRQQLAADFPAVPAYRLELAGTGINLGNVLRGTGRPKEAETVYRNALAVLKQLAADFPTVPKYRQDLAHSHNNLGLLLKDMERPQEAEAALRDALALKKQLAADFPAVADYQNELAETMRNLAVVLRARQELSQARQLLEQAQPHHQAALNANPRHPTYRQSFRNNTGELARTLAELGAHVLAAETAGQLLRLGVDPADDAYAAACILARCFRLAENDAKLPEGQRQAQAQSYADQALQALRQALTNGYKNVTELRKDPDLDPLRGREDFRRLLAELEEKAKSAAK